MNDPTNPISPRVEVALREYLERLDRGESINRQEFLAKHADIADALSSFLAAEDEVRKLAAGNLSGASLDISIRSSTAKGQETVRPRARSEQTGGQTPALPQNFGRYRIIRALGHGAMGTVYLAEDTRLDRRVAIKTPHFADDPSGEMLRRFYREAEAAARLRHPNICAVYDVGEIEGTHYISMAYVEGHPLSALIRTNKPQSERKILLALLKLARALEHAHACKILHRDLKPANIMVNKQGEPIIMDFGLARKLQKEEEATLTHSGVLVGSPAYMSPEQIEGEAEKIGPASDQYSLGVVAYELLTGQLPFRGSVVNVLAQIITRPPTAPSQLRAGLDPRIEVACLRMMAKVAKDRFESMKEVAEEFAAILTIPAAKPASSNSMRQSTPAPPKTREGRVAQTDVASQILKSVDQGLTESNLESLEELVGKCMARRDYEQVIKIVQRVPEERRSAGLQSAFNAALEKMDEIAFLVSEIDEADCLEDGVTARRKAAQLLKIKPGNHRAKEIEKKYSGYSDQARARLGPLTPFTRPLNEGGWIPWSALSFGLAVFAVVSSVFVHYLRSTTLEIDVRNQGVRVTVHGAPVTVTGPKVQKVAVEAGQQQLTISSDGLPTVTKRFDIAKGQKAVVVVSIVDQQLVVQVDNGPSDLAVSPPADGAKVRVAGAPGNQAVTQSEKKSAPAQQARLSGETSSDKTNVAEREKGVDKKGGDKALAKQLTLLVAPFTEATAKIGQGEWSAQLKSPVEFVNQTGMKLVLIPPGEFMMGTPPSQIEAAKSLIRLRRISEPEKTDMIEAEQPQHRVRITRAFYLGGFEVTRAQFAKFIEETAYKTESEKSAEPSGSFRTGLTWRRDQDDSHPVQGVSWNDAVAFCKWLSGKERATYRLPTEAEWEYACRGGSETLYYFGNDPEELTRYENVADASLAASEGAFVPALKSSDGFAGTSPVGHFRPNPFGLYDMLGNVAEWCQDWFDESYYSKSPLDDPRGPEGPSSREPRGWETYMAHERLGLPGAFGLAGNIKGSLKVLRGGSCNFVWGPSENRVSCRSYITPLFWAGGLGFRVVREVDPQNPVSNSPPAAQTAENSLSHAKGVGKPKIAQTETAGKGASPPNDRDPNHPIVLNGKWATKGDEVVQSSLAGAGTLIFGDPEWGSYDLGLQVRKTAGNNDVVVVFHWQKANVFRRFVIGGYNNTAADFASTYEGKFGRVKSSFKKHRMAPNRWYSIKIRVRRDSYQCYLDGKLFFQERDPRFTHGKIGLATLDTAAEFRHIKVTSTDDKILWQGLPQVGQLQ